MNTTSVQQATQNQPQQGFSIVDHIEKLTPAKEKNRYICPVCQGDNLTIGKSGAYQCWNGCECKEIRDLIAPLEQKKPIRPKSDRTWTYTDLQGNELIRTRRTDDGNGKRKIWQEYLVEGTWVSGSKIFDSIKVVAKKAVVPYRYLEALESAQNGAERIFWVEGEVCADALWNIGIPAITSIGGSGSYRNYGNYAAILAGLPETVQLVVAPDRDQTGMKYSEEVASDLGIKLWCKPYPGSSDWKALPKNGGLDIADWIEDSVTAETILAAIEERSASSIFNALPAATTNDSIIPVSYNKHGEPVLPKPSVVANALLERYRDTLIWSIETKRFFRYSVELPGMWSREPQEQLKSEIAHELDKAGLEYSATFVNSVLELIGNKVSLKRWKEPKDLIPMANGVLNRLDMKLLPHSPKYRFRWQLPYPFTERTNCQPILDWLLEAMEGHQDRVDVLLAYLKAIVTSRVDLQRFLELVGEGGTGKGTFLRLAMALTGKINTLPTSLKHLEGNRFETASIYGKRLVAITDSEKYSGDISTLKSLTGQDFLRFELKGIQQGDGADAGFYPDALVVIATNEPIRSLDHTSGIQRRRLTIPFNHQPDSADRRDLISLAGESISGEFAQYLPQLLTHVLLIPDDRVTELVRDTDKHCPSLREAVQENFLETNPLAGWLDDCCVLLPGSKTYIGAAKKIRRTEGTNCEGSISSSAWDEYQNTDTWLYANYKSWADKVGSSHPVSMKSFAKQLVSLCKAQLKLPGIDKGSDRSGSFITGLALRNDEHDHVPTPITRRVMDSVMDCDGLVMAESFAGDGLHGCDGLSKNSLEIGENEPSKTIMQRIDNASRVINKKDFAQNPSHPSQSVSSNGSSHHQSITNPSQSIAIHHKVGDRVQYIGAKHRIYLGEVLTVSTFNAGRVCCKRPDGSFTTWLAVAELKALVDL